MITKYTIVLKRLGGYTHVFSLPYGFNLTIYKNSPHFFLQSWLWLILFVTFLCSFALFWIVKLGQAFLLSIAGVIFWGALRRDLTYGKVLTLCVYALTPATLFTILILWLNSQFVLPRIVFEYEWIIYFVIALEFLLGGMVAIEPPAPVKTNEKTLTERLW